MSKTCIVIGAGHASAQLVQSLRQEGWEGSIVVIGEEAFLPYHRPPLSKAFLMGDKDTDSLLIRPSVVYEKLNVTFRLNSYVTQIDREGSVVVLEDGDHIHYDRLAVCTGSRARKIPLPGSDLQGVFYLRDIKDVEGIKEHVASNKNAVIVGGGYIGLETAAVLNKLGMNVTVLEMMERVLQRVTAQEISDFFTRVHTEEGVNIKTGMTVQSIIGREKAEAVVCSDGAHIDADLVIIGAGILPNVELAEAAGLAVDNGLIVDEYGTTSDENVFAAGDCTNHPNSLLGRRVRLESVPNAVDQAKSAAAAICGGRKAYAAHPWFWSDQYDIKLQIAGLNQGYDQVVVRGDQKLGRSFVVWYLKDGQLLAADCVNRAKEFVVAKQLLAKGLAVNANALGDESIEPKALLA